MGPAVESASSSGGATTDPPAANAAALKSFLAIGLDPKKAQGVVGNSKLTANLLEVIQEANVQDGCDRAVGNLLEMVATKFPASARIHRPTLLSYIASLQIKTVPQVEAAHSFLKGIAGDPLDIAAFETACGVGVQVTAEDIVACVSSIIEKEKEALLQERYRFNVGLLLASARTQLNWADGKLLKEEMDKQVVALLGPKTAEDEVKPVKKKGGKEKTKAALPEAPEATAAGVPHSPAAPTGAGAAGGGAVEDAPAGQGTDMDGEGIVDPYAIFPKPEENVMVHTEIFFSGGEIWRPSNTREALEKHLAATGGRVLTRFPPEPNGYLHIGHAKAMFVDFGLAKERGGDCYLRFDDTNPEAEKQEYIDHIQEIVNWLGWKPFKVTYSSDYFQELYDFAVDLIKRGHAYVDHQTAEEIKESREKHEESPWRNRAVSESLKLFEDMRRGLVDEGKATLRLKQDMKNQNPNMYDLIAYRIKFTPHPHAGSKWCIYPSYDYTHCIVDSLENITHSLCTLEFETRRASYYWLLEALGLYHPNVWEYGRLNITHCVMSKRKLNKLVTEGHVLGWDDPRLMTLAGLRRRGADPEAINAFCRGLGITRNETLIPIERLEHSLRNHLNATAPRVLVVLHPLKVVLTNVEEGVVEDLEAKKWPHSQEGDPDTNYKVPFSRVCYIEASDFRLEDSKGYYGLAPGKSVMLRFAYPIKCTDVIKNPDGSIAEIRAEVDKAKSTKPKGVVQWVAEPSSGQEPLKIEVRLIDKLFNSEDVSEVEDWLGDLNPRSMEIVENAYAVPLLANVSVGDKFQFERTGYFCVDPDSTTAGHPVFNRTVTLKESSSKAGGK